jgi:ribosomal protein S18 acetylase RimI-like enzyme
MITLDDFLVRPYASDDFVAVKRNLQDGALFDPDVDSPEQWARLIAHDERAILVGEYDRDVVANVFVIFNPWFSSIWHLAVRKEFRGAGIGKVLMQEAERSIIERGGRYASLYVKTSSQGLIKYYGEQGYSSWPEQILNLNKKLP